MKDGAEYIRELEMKIVELEGELRSARAGRVDVSVMDRGVKTIGKVLHDYAEDCEMKDEITEIIEKINKALDTVDGRFPRIKEITSEYELTVTYVVTVQASSNEDARDKFIDGDYDDLIELSAYCEFDVEEGC